MWARLHYLKYFVCLNYSSAVCFTFKYYLLSCAMWDIIFHLHICNICTCDFRPGRTWTAIAKLLLFINFINILTKTINIKNLSIAIFQRPYVRFGWNLRVKGIVSDSNNIILWHESEVINKKSLFQKFQLIPISRFQVMHICDSLLP